MSAVLPKNRSDAGQLLEIIGSLTEELKSLNEAAGNIERKHQQDVKKAVQNRDGEVASLKAALTAAEQKVKLLEREKGKISALFEKEQEKSRDLERQLAISHQKAKQFQDTLSISDKIHAESHEQTLKEVQHWREQCTTLEAARAVQTTQTNELLKLLKAHVSSAPMNTTPLETTATVPQSNENLPRAGPSRDTIISRSEIITVYYDSNPVKEEDSDDSLSDELAIHSQDQAIEASPPPPSYPTGPRRSFREIAEPSDDMNDYGVARVAEEAEEDVASSDTDELAIRAETQSYSGDSYLQRSSNSRHSGSDAQRQLVKKRKSEPNRTGQGPTRKARRSAR